MTTKLPCISAEIRFLQTNVHDWKGETVSMKLQIPMVKMVLESEYDFEAVHINGQWFVPARLLPPFVAEQFEKQWENLA